MNVHINPTKALGCFFMPQEMQLTSGCISYLKTIQFYFFIIESFSFRFPAITSGRLKVHNQNRSSHLIAY